MLEVWFSLLRERSHTFLLVSSGEGRPEDSLFVFDALIKRQVVGLVDAILGHGDFGKAELYL